MRAKTGKTAFIAALLLVLGAAAPTHAQEATGSEMETATVVEIQVKGNDHVDIGKIKANLPFKEGDEVTLPDDLERARGQLMKTGLFQEVSTDYRHTEEGIIVLLDVLENPVIRKIEIAGNRDWNADRRLHIPLVNWDLPWPFVDYLVTTERLKEVLKKHDIAPGQVLNTVKLKRALGIDDMGRCASNPPQSSICGEYQSKGYFLVSVADVGLGETLKIRLVEGVIESVEIRGLEEGPLMEKAREILSSIPVGHPVKRQTLQDAIQRLSESIYFEPLGPQDIGFLQGDSPDSATLMVTLRERIVLEQPQTVDRIEFRGSTAFSEAELQSRLELPEDPVSNYELLRALDEVNQLYRKEGYIFVSFRKAGFVDGVLTLAVDEGEIGEVEIRQNGYPTARWTDDGVEELPLDADADSDSSEEAGEDVAPAPEENLFATVIDRFTALLGHLLGTASSSDLPRTRPQIIAKELALEPGDLVNSFKLTESYRKLQQLGYFDSVDFNFEPLEGGRLRLIVDVVEKKRLGSLNGGLTISQQGLAGNLSVSGKNIYGMGQDVAIKFDRGIVGKTTTNWSLDYQGRLLLEGVDYLSASLFNNTSREEESVGEGDATRSYWLNRTGAEGSLALPWQEIQTVFGLRHERVTKEYQVDEGKPEVEVDIINAASLTVNADDRNNPIFATRGGRWSVTLERAGPFGLGTEEFTKFEAELIRHYPTYEDQNVAVRIVGGTGIDLPSQERFTLGGVTTVRGARSVQAQSMAFANLEYRIQFIPNTVSLAFFADVGTAGSLEKLKRSVGFEGRVTAPYVGPVRISFAWPITDRLEYVQIQFGFGTFF